MLQIPNYVADKIGPMNVLIPGCFTTALLAFFWTEIKTEAGLIVFCIIYGYLTFVLSQCRLADCCMVASSPGR